MVFEIVRWMSYHRVKLGRGSRDSEVDVIPPGKTGCVVVQDSEVDVIQPGKTGCVVLEIVRWLSYYLVKLGHGIRDSEVYVISPGKTVCVVALFGTGGKR